MVLFGGSRDVLNGLKKSCSCDFLWSANHTVNTWSMCFSVTSTGLEIDCYTSSRPPARPSAPASARREVSLAETIPPRIAAETVPKQLVIGWLVCRQLAESPHRRQRWCICFRLCFDVCRGSGHGAGSLLSQSRYASAAAQGQSW